MWTKNIVIKIMSKKLGIIMDPIQSINFKKDTSLLILLAAKKSGFTLYLIEQNDLYLDCDEPRALTAELNVFDDEKEWFELKTKRDISMSDLDVILMRKDPPFNKEYIYSTYILEAAKRKGVLIVNDPQSLRDCNEKIFATEFKQFTPPLIVTKNIKLLKAFLTQNEEVVYKPLDGMGGESIFKVNYKDENINVILETLTKFGTRTIMAQKYIADISNGDKRILIIDGRVIPLCLARIPPKGEFRGNLAAGGSGVVKQLSERDLLIANSVAEICVKRGLLFVGLDIIGDFLTEINVTSPTCAREIDKELDFSIGDLFMECISNRL
jgi:glutathione synthase